VHAGGTCPPPVEGLLTTVAWDLGESGPVAYALEGSVFSSGSALQWLRDGIGIIDAASEAEPLALTVDSSDGVSVVPAFTGLGSPHWDPYARGTVVGLSRGIGRAHLTRAVIEAMGFQVRDVVDAMEAAGTSVRALRVDGGAAVMGLLLQHQADQVRVPVARPRSIETTALGAATLAGLAEGVWGSLDELSGLWHEDVTYLPTEDAATADARHASWRRAVDRSRHWAAGD
jgi:glycerol kinase